MSYIVVDCESDGPIPGKYSLVSFGAIIVERGLSRTFYGETRPISDIWVPEALSVSGVSREEHLKFDDPVDVFTKFKKWVNENSKGRPIFISDNLAYDWQWINWYFHMYTDGNPFGFSGRRIGDLYAGFVNDTYVRWKHLRKTKHTHHPVDDAKGNAEALLEMQKMGLKIKFE